MKKKKAKLTPQIITPKILPGQRCVGTVPCNDHYTTPDGDENWKSPLQVMPPESRCTYVEPTEEERKAEARKMTLDYLRKRVVESSESAITTMENFMRNARRRLDDVNKGEPLAKDFTGEYCFLQLPLNVLHELSWGLANASGSVQNAMSAAHDFLRLEREPS